MLAAVGGVSRNRRASDPAGISAADVGGAVVHPARHAPIEHPSARSRSLGALCPLRLRDQRPHPYFVAAPVAPATNAAAQRRTATG